ncbi:hypothetical protein [Kibdelosporangium aridum]|nr:hypothetical protein [Kibdelosporangium aridum]
MDSIGVHEQVLVNARECLLFAVRRNMAVQLATKFRIPESILAIVNTWPSDGPKPVIFTTITVHVGGRRGFAEGIDPQWTE